MESKVVFACFLPSNFEVEIPLLFYVDNQKPVIWSYPNEINCYVMDFK